MDYSTVMAETQLNLQGEVILCFFLLLQKPILLGLKGQCHKIDIYRESFIIFISTFCLCADGFQFFLSLPHTSINFLIAP
jgi:hypothetical protein